ncbi:MAG: type IV pilus assembly protein PilM [bacterium]
MKKEDEIAATNKLLRLIRGEKGVPGSEESQDPPDDGDQAGFAEPLSAGSSMREGPSGSLIPEKDDSKNDRSFNNSDEPDHGSEGPDGTSDPDARREQESFYESHKTDANHVPSSLPPLISTASRKGTGEESEQEGYRQQGEIRGNIKSSLGLDIGSRYVKFVQLQRRMNKYHLIAWGIVKVAPKSPEGGTASVTPVLRGLLKGVSSSHTRLISSVGGASVIVRHIKFPPLSDKEIDESIRWEAKSYVPFPLRDVNIDYQILGKSTKNKQMDVLLVAVTKKLLQDHLDMLQSIQLKPSIIDINSLALVNSFSSGNTGKDERAVVLLDIGSSTTILNIYKKDDLYLTRDIPIAGDAFSLYLQKELHLTYEEVESIKRDGKFDINTIRPVLDNLTKEIRRSLIYYDNQTSRRGFSRIILSGGSARLPGIVHYLSEELGLTVEIANPLQTIQIDPKRFSQDELQFFSPQMALAVGLASR